MQVVTAPFWWVIFRFIGFLLGIALLLLIVVAGCNVILAFVGDPGVCDADDRTINISPANAGAFQAKWDAFDDQLEADRSGAVSFDESEITSRADTYLDGQDSPIKDVVICIHNGFGEGSGSLETPVGLDAKIKVKGNMDLTGDHPKVIIDEIKIGGIPDFLLGPVESFLRGIINDQMEEINLHHDYEPVLTEGNAEIKGTP